MGRRGVIYSWNKEPDLFLLLCIGVGISNTFVCLLRLDVKCSSILQGYYVFSQKLKHVVRLPFATTAYGGCRYDR
ncbi:unnamed protein product [Camellia sinensis]